MNLFSIQLWASRNLHIWTIKKITSVTLGNGRMGTQEWKEGIGNG
jgi:hypothetical protein